MSKEIRFTGVKRFNLGYELPVQQHLEYLSNILKEASPESLHMSISNCHVEGLFSLVFSGTESGSLVRAFIAYKKVEAGKVALHSHKYPIRITALTTGIVHHVATVHDNSQGHISLPKYRYDSSRVGPDRFNHLGNSLISLNDYSIPLGSMLYMEHHEIHTMSCEEGSIWVVEEKGIKENTSLFLGYPFDECNLYRKAMQSEIVESATYVYNAINNLLRKLGHGQEVSIDKDIQNLWSNKDKVFNVYKDYFSNDCITFIKSQLEEQGKLTDIYFTEEVIALISEDPHLHINDLDLERLKLISDTGYKWLDLTSTN